MFTLTLSSWLVSVVDTLVSPEAWSLAIENMSIFGCSLDEDACVVTEVFGCGPAAEAGGAAEGPVTVSGEIG